MTGQMEFLIPRKPEASAEELERMLYYLEEIADWASADVLMRWLEWPASEANRRRLRGLAEASGGRIASGPGTPGYKLTRFVTPAELSLVEGLKTQADRMRHRYTEIMRVWHSRKGGTHA